jgi:1-pyrroline-5-carboxylate dehydrogenase
MAQLSGRAFWWCSTAMTQNPLFDGLAELPTLANEPIKSYAVGSPERISIKAKLKQMAAQRITLPLVIAGQDICTGTLEAEIMPHDHAHVLADAHLAGPAEIDAAIASCLAARHDWAATPWPERAAIFLRAADLLSGPWRDTLNAATMLGQSKTVHQAEIDSAAELADFFRFNALFLKQLYNIQPLSTGGCWNRVDYRPLDGFVYAVTPFNFTSIAGNLPAAPALCGNTVLWKPSAAAKYSAHFVMALLREAGLPDGVINLVYGNAEEVTSIALAHPLLAGIHFTGSTAVFQSLGQRVGAGRYRSYPRLVGETGGKNFILAHQSADAAALSTAIVRGAFEYQGQKCSAASRLYLPKSLWPEIRDRVAADMDSIAMGDVADFRNFMGAVIHEGAWTRLAGAIAEAREAPYRIIRGGKADKSQGYFIAPTLVETVDPKARLMRDELFGPLATAYIYDDAAYGDVIGLVDSGSDYGLTGAVFAAEKGAVLAAQNGLRHAAGNFYINDKPTGAVVGQQPFGGGRASGTNDKAGSLWNLIRWVSPRNIKETFVPPRDFRYPFMSDI